jgi:hypothetical protein
MMQAGKDYLAKGDAEYESPRARYLRELLQSIKMQKRSDEPEEKAEIAPEEPVVKSTNQNKPTLKLK